MAAAYNVALEAFRDAEYPMLKDTVYLDHAGSALYSKSLMERFMASMMSGLYGNPHSASASSQLSTSRIEDTRLKALRFFNADPEDFDLVFVANATAGIKLVMEAFRGSDRGYSYAYHKDAHTSIVGVREDARSSCCLDDEAVEQWLTDPASTNGVYGYDLFAFPAQSNMDGHRLPLSWPERVRALSRESGTSHYTLLDASSLVSTSPLDLSNAERAPDFTVLSFYKIFGFPDLGALIIRKDSGAIFRKRKYFGGGTVDIVLCIKEQWHVLKDDSLHDHLEDGTLPTHSILALDAAIDVHRELYGSMKQIAEHTAYLAKKLHDGLSSLQHFNGQPVCVLHSNGFNDDCASNMQGPIVAFNLVNCHGAWFSNSEFAKLISVRNIQVRTGVHCNPGGVATCLGLEAWEQKRNFSFGYKCGSETDIYAGKITGVIRASVGAMSTVSDVEALTNFIREFYIENESLPKIIPPLRLSSHLYVESLTVYPIKSCAGFRVPYGTAWEVRPEGLAWDREWCLVHQGTGQALSQKRHPLMALFRPDIDFRQGVLRVTYHNSKPVSVQEEFITVPLSEDPKYYAHTERIQTRPSRVCGDAIVAHTYDRPDVSAFFSHILGVPCTLARFPAGGMGATTRHSKAHMQKHQHQRSPDRVDMARSELESGLPTTPDSDTEVLPRPILLSNESPILAINRSSLDALNGEIARSGGKLASAAVFRANVVIASSDPQVQKPYSEDNWTGLSIGMQRYQMLGSCRRCHMICIDQDTGEKNEEPFVTLSKTRRFDSKVFFGTHMCYVPGSQTKEGQSPTMRVGDVVHIVDECEEESI